MEIRNLARAAMVSAAAVTLASTPARAQLVTFSTSGAFGGGSCGPSLCTFGGYVLVWSGVSQATWTPPSEAVLGDFQTMCVLSGCPDGNILSGSTFMLTITQSGPNPGVGAFSGSLGWNPNSGLVSWMPNQSSVTIGGVTYGLTEDGVDCPVLGKACINISNSNAPYVPSFTDVKDDVTTTPEPATTALMATGLVGLIPFARRRRKS